MSTTPRAGEGCILEARKEKSPPVVSARTWAQQCRGGVENLNIQSTCLEQAKGRSGNNSRSYVPRLNQVPVERLAWDLEDEVSLIVD